MAGKEGAPFPEVSKKLGAIEQALAEFHSDYRLLAAKRDQRMAEYDEAMRSNDEDEYIRVEEIEEAFKDGSAELEVKVATALVEAFNRLSTMKWNREKGSPNPTEATRDVYRLPLNHMYELRLFRSLSYPKTEKGKTFNIERWNLNIESRNPKPANESSGERFPSEFLLNFETRTGSREILDLKPETLSESFAKTLLPSAIASFKRTHKL
ncbi:MAG: hypothetical protein KBD05_00660 [Candidatus Pacebacteria bacterium]|nr:hypothetical protein [Candidatus Paceibacterota bacterium]